MGRGLYANKNIMAGELLKKLLHLLKKIKIIIIYYLV